MKIIKMKLFLSLLCIVVSISVSSSSMHSLTLALIRPLSYIQLSQQGLLPHNSFLSFKFTSLLSSPSKLFSLSFQNSQKLTLYFYPYLNQACLELQNRIMHYSFEVIPQHLYKLNLNSPLIFAGSQPLLFQEGLCKPATPTTNITNSLEIQFTSSFKTSHQQYIELLSPGCSLSPQGTCECLSGYIQSHLNQCVPCDQGCFHCDKMSHCKSIFKANHPHVKKPRPSTHLPHSPNLKRYLQPNQCLSKCLQCQIPQICQKCEQQYPLIGGGCFNVKDYDYGVALNTYFSLDSLVTEMNLYKQALVDTTHQFQIDAFYIDDGKITLSFQNTFLIPQDVPFKEYMLSVKLKKPPNQSYDLYPIQVVTPLDGCKKILRYFHECQECDEPTYTNYNGACIKSKMDKIQGQTDVTTFDISGVLTQIQNLSNQLEQRKEHPESIFLQKVVIVSPDSRESIEILQTTFKVPSTMSSLDTFNVNVLITLNVYGEEFLFLYQTLTLSQSVEENTPPDQGDPPPSQGDPSKQPSDQDQGSSNVDNSATLTSQEAQIKSFEISVSEDNACSCTKHGECVNYICECKPGYLGMFCQFRQSDNTKISQIVESVLSQLETTLDHTERTEMLQFLSTYETFLKDQKFQEYTAILRSEISHTSHTHIKMKILTNLCKTNHSNRISPVMNIETQFVQSLLPTYQNSVHYESPLLDITIKRVHSGVPCTINGALQIEAGVIGGHSDYLSVVKTPLSIYRTLDHERRNIVTGTVTVQYFKENEETRLRNLTQPFQLHMPIQQQGLNLPQSWDSSIPSNLNDPPNLVCAFWNKATHKYSQEGCILNKLEGSVAICNCTHLTDFVGFFETGLDVLTGSNYFVLSAVTKLTWANLWTNLGFTVTIAYFSSFMVLALLFNYLDRKKLKHNYFEQILLTLHKESEPQIKYSARRSLEYNTEDACQVGVDKKPPRTVQKYSSSRIMRALTHDTERKLSIPIQFTHGHIKIKDVKRSKTILKFRKEANQSRSCCCKITRVAVAQIKEKNLPFNIVATTQLFSSRVVRLSLFYLTLLVQFSICALFEGLEQEEEDVAFWDQIIENFWVALYTVLISMIPLFVVGWLLSFPKSIKRSLGSASKIEEVKKLYSSYKTRILARELFGFVSFISVSLFLCLYITCFAHMASYNLSKEWVQSTLMGVGIDQIIFEIMPGICIGVLILMVERCKCRRGSGFFIALIELYRVYKNLTDS